MRSWLGQILIVLCLGVISAGHSQPALAFTNGAAADLVLGQTNFITGTSGTTSATMAVPTSVAVDATTGKVFVADGSNNRVLRFASLASLSNGSAAEAVLGQPDFTSSSTGTGLDRMSFPTGIHVDAGGRLWVADSGNNRVLRFDNAATLANGASADAFLGTGAAGCSSATLSNPAGLYTDSSGGLWVADANNNRVLRFANAATLANSASASTVFGQPDFTTCNVAASAAGMNGPQSVYFDSGGRLWVADTSNNRVLRFDSASSLGNGSSASGVLGQPDFTSALAEVSQTGMNAPIGVVGDAEGNLYVSDANNNRVLIHDDAAAESNGAPAANVLGQTDFTTSTSGLTASTLNFPERLAFDDSLDVLLVADAANNRVLGFTAPPSCTMGAGIPQTPPKPPKNAGLVKISKGLSSTPAVKDTKFKVSGTLENCQNFPIVPGSAGPITAGAFKLSLEVSPGSTCAGITSGFPVKSSLSITWNTPDPVKPGKFKKVSSEKTTLASYLEPSVNPIILGAVSQDFGPKSKTPGFMTKHAVLSFTMDQNAAQIAMGCADPKKGLAVLNFTGVNGPSTLEIH